MAEQIVGRRKALKYFALLTGSAAGRDFLAGWLPSASGAATPGATKGMHSAHQAPPAPGDAAPYTPQFFKPEEFETVEVLTETIIPTDDKPGAREAQVARYIDFVVFSAAEHQPSLQTEWTSGLALLKKTSQEKFNRSFRQLSPEEREKLLMEMSLPERNAKASHPGFSFYKLVKDMTVEGFYTSRVGLIDVLEYQGLGFLSEFPGCTHPEHQS